LGGDVIIEAGMDKKEYTYIKEVFQARLDDNQLLRRTGKLC
jgi:hypothetical protein